MKACRRSPNLRTTKLVKSSMTQTNYPRFQCGYFIKVLKTSQGFFKDFAKNL